MVLYSISAFSIQHSAFSIHWRLHNFLYLLVSTFFASNLFSQTANIEFVESRGYRETVFHTVKYDPLVSFSDLAPGEYLDLLSREPEVTEIQEGWDMSGDFWRITDYLTPKANMPDYMEPAAKSVLSKLSTSFYGVEGNLLFSVDNSQPTIEKIIEKELSYQNGGSFGVIELADLGDAAVSEALANGGQVTYSIDGSPIVTYNGVSLSSHDGGTRIVETLAPQDGETEAQLLTGFEEVSPGGGRFSYSLESTNGVTSTGYCYQTYVLTSRRYLESLQQNRLSVEDKLTHFHWLQAVNADKSMVKLVPRDHSHMSESTEVATEMTFSLISVDGRVHIDRVAHSVGKEIELPHLAPGVYLIQANVGGVNATELLIIP